MNVDVDLLREAQKTTGGQERGLGDLDQTRAECGERISVSITRRNGYRTPRWNSKISTIGLHTPKT